MKYTLQDFLNDHLALSDVLTQPQDFSSVAVISTRIQEPPFDEFFNKGEIIISKVWGWETDTSLMEDLVLIAHEKEVAALIWALHDKDARIPASVVRLADTLAVTLIEVPWETNFADLQADVFSAIHEKEIAALQQIQQSLFDQFFELVPLKKTASLIHRELNCAVRITDRQGVIIGESDAIPEEPDPACLLRSDIAIGGFKYGEVFLYLLDGPENPLYDHEDYAQKYIAFPLSFWFNRQNIELMTEGRYRNDFVWDLATGSEASREELLAQGQYLGFDLTTTYFCVMLYVRFEHTTDTRDPFTPQLAQMTADVEQAILQEARRQGVAIMAAHVNQSFIIYIGNKPPYSEQALDALLDRFEAAALQTAGLRCTFLWGISDLSENDPGFAVTYRQARQALTLGMHGSLRETRIFYRNTRRALIGSVLSESDAVRESAEEVFKDLLAYDEHSKVGLMQTLMVYLATNYNASQTAKELHLNRHSLLYRLEKIEQLTGLSLHDHEDLFVLEAFALAHAE